MEFVEDSDFNELISNFKKLSIIEKKQLAIMEIKDLIDVLSLLKFQSNGNSKILFNHEMFYLNDANYSEEYFVEAVYACIYSIKEALADLFLHSTDTLE